MIFLKLESTHNYICTLSSAEIEKRVNLLYNRNIKSRPNTYSGQIDLPKFKIYNNNPVLWIKPILLFEINKDKCLITLNPTWELKFAIWSLLIINIVFVIAPLIRGNIEAIIYAPIMMAISWIFLKYESKKNYNSILIDVEKSLDLINEV